MGGVVAGRPGFRQTEPTARRSSDELFLWSWVNPRRTRDLEVIRLRAVSARVVVAAITLSHVDGGAVRPRTRAPRSGSPRPTGRSPTARIVGTRHRRSGGRLVRLPLACEGPEPFLRRSVRRAGARTRIRRAPTPTRGSRRVPSATVGPRPGPAPARIRGVTSPRPRLGRARRRPRSRSSSRDAAGCTSASSTTTRAAPLPCRVHFRSPEGMPYQPHGHHDHVNSDLGTWHVDVGGDVRLGRLTYAYIDGTCQGWLPTGDVLVDVARGFEYEPIRARSGSSAASGSSSCGSGGGPRRTTGAGTPETRTCTSSRRRER